MTNMLRRWAADRRIAVPCSLACAALSAALAFYLLQGPRKLSLRMSAGPAGTRRYDVATYLGEQAAKNKLKIELSTDAGSEASLERLKSGELDAAVVSSGLVVPGDDDLAVVAGMQLEPVHLIVRKDLPLDRQVGEAIRGRRINLGVPGSTEWHLTRDFLAFARMKFPSNSGPGDFIPTEFGKPWILEQAQAVCRTEGPLRTTLLTELPDCLIVIASLPSNLVQALMETGDYRLAPLPAARAFLLDNLQHRSPSHPVLLREYLEPATVPARSYFAVKGFPESDCETLGVRLAAVVRKDAPSAAVGALMKTLFEGEVARRLRPKSPRDLATSYPIHPAAEAYLDRDKPLAIAEAMQWVSNGFSFLGAFTAGALSLYGLLGRRKHRTPADYYAEIRTVERIAVGEAADSAGGIPTRELLQQLDERLYKLRQQLIEDICEGRIKGDQVISNILHLLSDARQSIPARERLAGPALHAYRPSQAA